MRAADKNGALPGDIVWIEETGGALARRARIVERIGPMSDPRTVSLISIAANDIPVDFPEAALEEAEKAKAAPMGHRLDLRERAAGHDRRRGCARLRRCGVRRARRRPSRRLAHPRRHRRRRLVRAPRPAARPRRLPPRHLGLLPRPGRADAAGGSSANHWCSLVPREDRPVLVAEMWIDAEGHLKRHKFHRAMMRSAARLTYNRVQTRHGRHARRRDRTADGQGRAPALRRLPRLCWRRARSAARSTSICRSGR